VFSIKAASLNTRGGDEAMVTFSKELGASILSCVQVFYTARYVLSFLSVGGTDSSSV
jgi:hypothetical protein